MLSIFLLLVMLGSSIQSYRLTLVQHQVCTQDQQEVVCRCQTRDNQTYLGLRIQGFHRQVSSLVLESCHDLILNLDLRGLNLSSLKTVIRDSRTVLLDTILVDYRHSFAQTFNLKVYKVKNFTLSGVKLMSSVQISADNVGQFTVSGCTFSSLPRDGLTVSGLAKLTITENIFSMIQSQSVVVRQTRELEMMNNQLGVSAPNLDILSYSSSVLVVKILCNRLLGSPPSPDCDTEVSPEARTTTLSPYLAPSLSHHQSDWAVTATGTLLSLAIISFISYLSYSYRHRLTAVKSQLLTELGGLESGGGGGGGGGSDTEQEDLTQPERKVEIPLAPPCPPSLPSLPSPHCVARTEADSGVAAPQQSVSQPPVWLQEIKSNEIFNKKKKLANNDREEEEEQEEEEGDELDDEYPHLTLVRHNLDTSINGRKEYVF